MGGGLNKFDLHQNRSNDITFIHYQHDPEDPNSIKDNDVLSIHEDMFNTLWIGTSNNISKFDRYFEKL